jgi:hypothetical protein
MSGKAGLGTTFVVLLLMARPTLADGTSVSGVEVGLRTGYALSAGRIGTPPGGADDDLGNWVVGQWPIWVDAGYRFSPSFYLGGYFQYGFGFVNDDRQSMCRQANVHCSASDIRLGVMGRYNFAPSWRLAPWVGLGMGYEWGSWAAGSVQTAYGIVDFESSWTGYEVLNLQFGADYRFARRFTVAPFVSLSLGRFQSWTNTSTVDSRSYGTGGDLLKNSFHEWFLFGGRVAFTP